jgi:DUF4097 and DUF4098 domain-containing protein YvlB
MKKKEIFIVLALIAFGFIYNAIEKGRFRFHNDLTYFSNEHDLVSEQYIEFPQREMAFPAPARIVVDNPAGEVNIEGSADGQVHLQPLFRVYSQDKADSGKVAGRAQIRARMDADELKIAVDYGAAFPYRQLRVHLKIQVPEGSALAIGNQDGNVSIRRGGADVVIRQERGNVFLENLPAAVQVELRAGNLIAKNIAGKVSVNIRNGDVNVDSASALQLNGKHGNFSLKKIKGEAFIDHAFGEVTLDGAGKAEILGRHSEITARHIENGALIKNTFAGMVVENCKGDIRLSGRSGQMKISGSDARKMVIENSFADIAISDCAGESLDVLLKNGNLDFQDSRFSERMNIESRQANIFLSLGELPDPTFNVRTMRGRIFNRSAIEMEIFEEKGEHFANRGGQKPEIIINNQYGDIHLN